MAIGIDEAGRGFAGGGPGRGSQWPAPLTDEELARLDLWVRSAIDDAGKATILNAQCAADVARLVAEVHRLRQLILLVRRDLAGPGHTRDLLARLDAEASR
jgi:hypothetical protein